jgi:hypothetical protein
MMIRPAGSEPPTGLSAAGKLTTHRGEIASRAILMMNLRYEVLRCELLIQLSPVLTKLKGNKNYYVGLLLCCMRCCNFI